MKASSPSSMKADREATFVIESGAVVGLAGGPISLADMGERRSERASHLIFNPNVNLWVVIDAKSHERVFSHADYDVALEWERVEYNRRLAA